MDVNEYLNTIWYGNTIRTWLIAATILAAAIAALMAIKALLVGRFFKFANRTTNEIDDLAAELLKRTRLTVLVILMVAAIGMALLVLAPGVRTVIKFIAVIALFFQGMSWGNGIISFWMQRYAARRGMTSGPTASTVGALVVLARVALFLVLLLFALDNLGFKIAPLIAGLGIGGIAVALAVQNILGDLFAALSIVIDKPFVVGDFIVIDTHAGTVEHIGLKSTRIRSLSGEQIIVGNADLLKARINNFKRMVERRAVFTFGVVYETSAEQLKRIPVIVREAIAHQQMTRFDRCHFQSYGEYDLKFETVYWVLSADYNQYMDIQQGINLELFTRFADEQIHFAQRSGTIRVGAQGSPS